MLEVDADNERVFYYRGIARLQKGEYAEAIEDLSRSITLNHERGTAFFARGIAYAITVEAAIKKALRHCRRAFLLMTGDGIPELISLPGPGSGP